MNNKNIPLAICIVIIACQSIALISAAALNFQVSIPVIGDIIVQNPELQLASFDFTYNSITHLYIAANVGVQNLGTTIRTGSLKIQLYNSNGTEIASGLQLTGAVSPSITVGLTVAINWQPGNTVANFTRGTYQLIDTTAP